MQHYLECKQFLRTVKNDWDWLKTLDVSSKFYLFDAISFEMMWTLELPYQIKLMTFLTKVMALKMLFFYSRW